MSITRRQLLTSTGVSLPASALVSTRAMSIGEVGRSDSNTLDDWSVVRDQFNLSPEYIHLATFALVSHPLPVREAIQKYRRALDENPFLVVDRGLWGPEAENLPHKVREAAAEYVGGRPEEIALTGNTTMGLALVYYGLPLKAGQEVLTTAHDHFSHHEAIRLATERAGATSAARSPPISDLRSTWSSSISLRDSRTRLSTSRSIPMAGFYSAVDKNRTIKENTSAGNVTFALPGSASGAISPQ